MPAVPLNTLALLPSFDQECSVTVVIETPKGSRNTYGDHAERGVLMLEGVLPDGTAFPYDVGFVPFTIGRDDVPLDGLLFLDAPTPPGCVVPARPAGAIEARQRQGAWKRNDRLLAVPAQSRAQSHVHSLADLRPGLLDEVERFFDHDTNLQGRRFEPIARAAPDGATALLEAGRAAFAARRPSGGHGSEHGAT